MLKLILGWNSRLYQENRIWMIVKVNQIRGWGEYQENGQGFELKVYNKVNIKLNIKIKLKVKVQIKLKDKDNIKKNFKSLKSRLIFGWEWMSISISKSK